ncbi:MAG: hypothetical protein HXX08_02655 [Chloroflexi bacterium]|uniref:Uncharacterized protein n=1 Tax=Candidatus Chlorohelix allophototropha TaxID=3003348 RepID=A0A8T7M1S7_9CHLR|nr:hypothetical protein [Chloroflexota bacterium]WJW66640.1 hypothetical protein OZ401_002451 [Chloroflexota bacterium L227-S17]
MEVYQLLPKVGIGPVKFDMTRAEVYAAMPVAPSSVLPEGVPPGEENQTFYYHNSYVVAYSASDGKVIQIGVDVNKEISVHYRNIDIFNIRVEELIEILGKETPYDKDDFELGYSYLFPEYALALYRPSLPEDFKDLLGGDDFKYYEEDYRRSHYFKSLQLVANSDIFYSTI